jgi:hypothetical protein
MRSKPQFQIGTKVIAVRDFGLIEEGAPGIVTGTAEYPFLWWSRSMYLCTFAGNVKIAAKSAEIDEFDHGCTLEEIENPDFVWKALLRRKT